MQLGSICCSCMFLMCEWRDVTLEGKCIFKAVSVVFSVVWRKIPQATYSNNRITVEFANDKLSSRMEWQCTLWCHSSKAHLQKSQLITSKWVCNVQESFKCEQFNSLATQNSGWTFSARFRQSKTCFYMLHKFPLIKSCILSYLISKWVRDICRKEGILFVCSKQSLVDNIWKHRLSLPGFNEVTMKEANQARHRWQKYLWEEQMTDVNVESPAVLKGELYCYCFPSLGEYSSLLRS